MILRGIDAYFSAWVASALGCRPFGPSAALGWVDGSEIGAVVFHGYYPEAGVVEMSAASNSPRWLGREMIRAAFGHAFDTMGCQMVVWRVAADNDRTIRLAERLGFIGHLIPRLGGRDLDEIIFTLTDDAWRSSRFARSQHGQEVHAVAA